MKGRYWLRVVLIRVESITEVVKMHQAIDEVHF
jgi:hypothetical protein